ncbi:GNAT family N-acetyltransferase [Marivita sp.]|jgi:ribosomal protein S18 acetylase RimI-like enzyme|uniref:GNAT family N-acetyltransferase n=1 Tax=Marivita sp. TaxID=2003365 RepID=UPI003F6A87E7
MLGTALERLSHDLGDPYHATEANLAQALWGACPSAWARLAHRSSKLAGVVLFSPVYSTTQGGAGVYVSDLWVDAEERGHGLGQALLREAAHSGNELWSAQFMRLAVYNDNARASALYQKLGFARAAGQSTLALTGPWFQALRGQDESHS